MGLGNQPLAALEKGSASHICVAAGRAGSHIPQPSIAPLRNIGDREESCRGPI